MALHVISLGKEELFNKGCENDWENSILIHNFNYNFQLNTRSYKVTKIIHNLN